MRSSDRNISRGRKTNVNMGSMHLPKRTRAETGIKTEIKIATMTETEIREKTEVIEGLPCEILSVFPRVPFSDSFLLCGLPR